MDDHINSIFMQYLNCKAKPEQHEALLNLVNGKHVFVNLATGYGKSAIFALFPLIMDKVHQEKKHCTVVLSPLRSLIQDQVLEWEKRGVKSVGLIGGSGIKQESHDAIVSGHTKVVFTTPEMLTSLSQYLTSWPISLIAVDEVHCLVTWGNTFRQKYKQLRRLRATMDTVPFVALTATAPSKLIADTEEILGILDFQIVQAVPNRGNIYLAIKDGVATFSDLQWYISDLVEKGTLAPKAIIFCRSIDTVTNLYGQIFQKLRSSGADHATVEFFHAHLDDETERTIPRDFKKSDGHVRCLISTVAFGMGVQVSNVTYVIHWGPPSSIIDYFQEIGRCCRDGSEGEAIMYTPPNTLRKDRVSPDLLLMIERSKKSCMRMAALCALKLRSCSEDELKVFCYGPRCCSYCNGTKK